MDQLKVFLKQAVKYRFWIAIGISFLLPLIGYAVGFGTINTETTTREKAIKDAKTEIAKYTTPGIVNGQYQPEAAKKKEVLVQDVDATWRKLFATQEPLLKWPPEVEARFRKWGRKYPADVDRNQIQTTLINYTVAYPAFWQSIYKIFKPFNFDDGTGIVVAPEPNVLIAPADFKQESPPDLTLVWAEQDRLWVLTALLDAIAKVNDSVGAKDWDGAIVKQINVLEVGASTDQDQKSMAKGEALLPPDPIADPSAPPPAAPVAASEPNAGKGGEGGMMNMGGAGGGGGGMGNAPKTTEVLYVKTDSPQYKALPIKMSVLVDQGRMANFLVGLENSPMSIEINEVEFSKPLTPVVKPAYGERPSFGSGGMGMGMGMSMMGGSKGDDGMSSMGRAMGNMSRSGGGMSPGGAMGGDMMPGGRGMMPGMGGGASKASGGVDIRNQNTKKAREEKAKKEKEAAAKSKTEKKIDQYYNVIEVTVYGRARFYLAPPPPPELAPSTAAASNTTPPSTPDPTKVEAAPTTPSPVPADPAKPADTPKEGGNVTPPDSTAKKEEPPKAETPPAETPKAETPKTDPAPKP